MLKLQDKNIRSKLTFSQKGSLGEDIALSVVLDYNKRYGSADNIIISSFKYNYIDGVPGNIHYNKEKNKFFEISGKKYKDEIDILYITDYKIFIIEVKARSGKWVLANNWTYRGTEPEEKCPFEQTEKHARQLYENIWTCIPNGNPLYIEQTVLFVDKAKIIDRRGNEKFGIGCNILNTFKKWLIEKNKPLEYLLDKKALNNILISISKNGI